MSTGRQVTGHITRTSAHWPGLDGLRGIAALAVVAFHLGLGGIAPNGFTGVDVFFALSGFLITSLLLAEHARAGRIDLRNFYVRRALRLYPALLALCLGAVVLALLTDESQVLAAAAAALLYVANWWIFTGHEAPLLEHTWTLAIEEHFYLLWPALLGLLLSRRLRLLGLALGAALLVVLALPWGDLDGVRGSYLRGAPIVWGSLLAGLVHSRPALVTRHITPWISWVGLLATAGLVLVLIWPQRLDEGLLTGPLGLVGLATVVVVAAVVLRPESPGVRWLRWSALTWAGRRSYGIYLYHFPILSLLRHHVPVGPLELRLALGVLVTLLVAEASYRIVELPFLRAKSRFTAR